MYSRVLKLNIFICHPLSTELSRLTVVRCLVCFFQSSLKMDSHVLYILSQCAQRMYILKLLRSQRMPIAQLSTVAYSLIIARILYARPAWGGFITSEHIKSYGYIHTLCPEKSKSNTMYHRNVKSECILCKYCMLFSEVFCETCTTFRLKILSDSRVINL